MITSLAGIYLVARLDRLLTIAGEIVKDVASSPVGLESKCGVLST